jgi:hypothetical protein
MKKILALQSMADGTTSISFDSTSSVGCFVGDGFNSTCSVDCGGGGGGTTPLTV